jgi:CheY-like chemotaxis protein
MCPSSSNDSSAHRRNATLLVIDDNDDDVELLRIALGRTGSALTLTVATNGEAALRGLAGGGDGGSPDVVLLDWKMPGISGAEVLEAIRHDPATRGLPVFVFSSSDSPEDLRVATELGATGYLPKPADMGGYVSLARALDEAWCGRAAPRT